MAAFDVITEVIDHQGADDAGRHFTMHANRKPTRPWPVIAAEVKAESDPTVLLKLVEELNRAMAEQGVGSAKHVSENKTPTSFSKTAWRNRCR